MLCCGWWIFAKAAGGGLRSQRQPETPPLSWSTVGGCAYAWRIPHNCKHCHCCCCLITSSRHHVHDSQLQVDVVVEPVHLHGQVDEHGHGDADHQHITKVTWVCGGGTHRGGTSEGGTQSSECGSGGGGVGCGQFSRGPSCCWSFTFGGVLCFQVLLSYTALCSRTLPQLHCGAHVSPSCLGVRYCTRLCNRSCTPRACSCERDEAQGNRHAGTSVVR